MTLTHDAEVVVVQPIAGIIKNVNKMEQTLKFLRGANDDDEEEVFEMNRIATAMQKMATLLRIGFGDAGNAIISKNLVGGNSLNAMLPGRHVTAIFGFCDIRKFTDTTEVLRAQVMPFVNFCADIVHERAVRHGGAPNKNVGDAFLIVWKTETFNDDGKAPRRIKRSSLKGTISPVQEPEPEKTKQEQERERRQRQRRLSLVPTDSSAMQLALSSMAAENQKGNDAIIQEGLEEVRFYGLFPYNP